MIMWKLEGLEDDNTETCDELERGVMRTWLSLQETLTQLQTIKHIWFPQYISLIKVKIWMHICNYSLVPGNIVKHRTPLLP